MLAYPADYEEFTASRSWCEEVPTSAIHVDHARGMLVGDVGMENSRLTTGTADRDALAEDWQVGGKGIGRSAIPARGLGR